MKGWDFLRFQPLPHPLGTSHPIQSKSLHPHTLGVASEMQLSP